MSEKTFFGKEINFNKAPVMWAGMEVYPGDGATSNLYGTLNVIKNPKETIIPDINTDGNLNVELDASINGNLNVEKDTEINGNLTVNSDTTLNKNFKANKNMILAGCGDVASRINRADALPTSDRNLKENITPLQKSLDKVLKLNGVEFDFIDESNYGYLKKHQIGLIAQDVKKIVPEVVSKNLDGYYGISYHHLVVLLIESIKEQQEQINELKEKLNNI